MMTTENQTLCNSASKVGNGLSLLEKALRYRRLAGFQTNDDIKVKLLALAVEYELLADQMAAE
jgi:hypothetical protein